MKIISLDRDDTFEKIISVLEAGDIVALPTDTVYGFIADVACRDAISKMFRIKKRDSNKPLGIFVSGFSMLEEYAIVPPECRTGLDRLWPGPLTAVLVSKNILPAALHPGTLHIGVRVPADDYLLEIIHRIGRPLIQTSANLSGEDTPRTASDIERVFRGSADLRYVIDAGKPVDTIQSTVIDCTTHPPRILRKGALSRAELEEAFQLQFESAMNK